MDDQASPPEGKAAATGRHEGRSRHATRDSGFVMLAAGMMLVVLIAFLGLSFDVGYLQWTRRRAQTAADSAAVAGAQEVKRASTDTTITTAARNDSALNGFTHGTSGVTVTVNHPPLSGAYTGDSSSVEAIVTRSAPLYFLRVLGITATNVRARSVARLGSSSDCVFVLDPAMDRALFLNGAMNITLHCGAIVDSSSSQAFYLNGAINWDGPTDIVGGYTKVGAININPAPNMGAAEQSDPLAYVPAPTYGGCTQTNFQLSGAYNTTLNPGVYCGGIRFSGAGNIILNPGLYVLLGGGLTVSAATNITGTGITFYNTADAGHTYGPISISGANNITLSAPTTGAQAGMLFFQDRTIAHPAPSTISGAANAKFIGAVYFPTSALTYSGASNGQYTILVAKSLTFKGASNVDADYSSLPSGSPVKGNAVLGE